MLPVFFSVFGVIFVAELPDKTALAAVVLATRFSALAVFLGTAAALTIQSGVAVAAGSLISLLPARYVHVGAGILFLASAVVMWRRKDDAPEEERGSDSGSPATFGKAFATVFTVVFIAEWGDLTQIGTAALAARYRAPFTVFAGSTLALWSVAAIAVFVGNRAAKFLDPDKLQKVAAVVFAAIGLLLVFDVV
jgi:putative Ca2+/H+ antiporter (TMEM165/GDT1 family)